MGLSQQATPFSLTLPADGRGAQVIVGGVDVTDQVEALRLDTASGRPTVLTLVGQAGGIVQGEGIVQTQGDVDPAAVIVDFLSKVDPMQLEARAVNRDDVEYGEGMTMRAALKTLAEWASGE